MNRRRYLSIAAVTGISAFPGCNTGLTDSDGGGPEDSTDDGPVDTQTPSDEHEEPDLITEFEGEGSEVTDTFEFEGDAILKIRASGNIEAYLLDRGGEREDELIVETEGNHSSITSNYVLRGGAWAIDLTTDGPIKWRISVRRIEWQEAA